MRSSTSPLTPAGERILRSASELFYARGIQAIGVDAIARAASVTKKTIYDCFGSKDALIERYLTARAGRWHRWLDDAVDAEQDAAERLLGAFDALDSWMRREGGHGCAFVNACAELTASEHPGRLVSQREKAWMLGFFQTLAREAGARQPDDLARQLFMLHEGAIVAYAITADDTACATARDAAAALIARALAHAD